MKAQDIVDVHYLDARDAKPLLGHSLTTFLTDLILNNRPVQDLKITHISDKCLVIRCENGITRIIVPHGAETSNPEDVK